MNKNGIVAVVVVITAVVLVGLWVMRSGQTRPGGRQFDCAAPPSAPTGLAYTKSGSRSGLNDQGTYVVPATQTSFGRPTPVGTFFVRVFARNACGTSPASNEVTFSIP